MQGKMEDSKRIRIYLDGKGISIFKGMKVKHILDIETIKRVEDGDMVITDADGHERGLQGSLSEGEKLFKKEKKT